MNYSYIITYFALFQKYIPVLFDALSVSYNNYHIQ